MNAATPSAAAFTPGTKPTSLRSLMQMWEEESAEEESETELMVMLSGMVGPHATSFDD